MKKMMGLVVLVIGLLTFPCAGYARELRITGDGIIRTSGSLLISGDEAWRAIYTYVYSNNNYSGIVGGRRARGSSDSQLAVMAGDSLFWLNARGHDGNSFGYWSDAAIGFIASENFDTSSHGTYIAFYTTINGSNSKNEKMRLTDSGNVGIGTTSPSEKLEVNGNVRADQFLTGDIIFHKDDKPVWRMYEDEKGLYVQSLTTEKNYALFLEEVGDVKAAKAELQKLNAENQALQAKVSDLEARLAKLEAVLTKGN